MRKLVLVRDDELCARNTPLPNKEECIREVREKTIKAKQMLDDAYECLWRLKREYGVDTDARILKFVSIFEKLCEVL